MGKFKNHELALGLGERAKVVLETSVKVGKKKLHHKISKISIKKKNTDAQLIESTKTSQTEQRELAEIIFQGLCKLRGTAMKLAQYISTDQEFLTPEHLEVLQQSHYKVPPLNPVIVSKMIRNELKENKETLFISFDNQAFAAASLGQVHRAKTLMGEDVAVKIQYPGIDQTVSIDLGMVKKILSVVPNNLTILNSLNSIEKHLFDEVNYLVEQENAKIFYNFFCEHRLISNLQYCKIPLVHTQLSSQRVITYEFIHGLSIQEWLQSTPNQEQRNQLGQKLWQFFFESVFKLKAIHADPNWGNFLITDKEQLAILDFGCIQLLSDDAITLFRSFFQPEESISNLELLLLYIKLGAEVELSNSKETDRFCESVIKPYRNWIKMLIYRESFYENSFSNNNWKISIEGLRILFKEIFSVHLKSFSNEFTLLHRTFFGILKIIETIEAKLTKEFKLSVFENSQYQ